MTVFKHLKNRSIPRTQLTDWLEGTRFNPEKSRLPFLYAQCPPVISTGPCWSVISRSNTTSITQ